MSKIIAGIEQAIRSSGLKSGMTVSFHHHLRNGDYVLNLVLAEQGMLLVEPRFTEVLEGRPFTVQRLPGGHHLHLDSAAGAQAVADCFNPFFAGP